MKIAWFTPFSVKSAIGKYSQSITNDLVKYCSIDLYVNDLRDNLITSLDIFPIQKYAENNILRKYDFIVYNIGNNLQYHKDIFETSNKHPGIVILHDFVMHHFFAAYYLDFKKNRDAYIGNMEFLYGKRGKITAENIFSNRKQPVWETDEVIDYPFFEKAIGNAYGIIVHSKFLACKVKEKFLQPVGIIHHPFYSYCGIERDKIHGKKNLKIEEEKMLLLSVGYVNPNKRIDKVIRVLGENKRLREKIRYIIIGPCEHLAYYGKLNDLLQKYQLNEVVKFLGYLEDSALYEYMTNADVFINLRYPPTEGASGSLLEQLFFCKPVIVTDVGFYSELPDECLIKISLSREESDIENALNRMIEDYTALNEIGCTGHKFAMENFTTQKYCEKFLKYIGKVEEYKTVHNLLEKIGSEMAFMGLSTDNLLIDRLSQEITSIIENLVE